MRTWIIVASLLAAAYAASINKKAPLLADTPAAVLKDEYIVVFNEHISDEEVRQHHSLLNNMMEQRAIPTNEVHFHYHIGSFRGYSVTMDEGTLDQVRELESVQYVERNQVFTIDDVQSAEACVNQNDATWGLVRTTQREKFDNNDKTYNYDTTDGEGVNVYILDTGIEIDHPDFEGRAVYGYDFINDQPQGTDGHGHGTHCAGTVMSKTWGLAKKATATAVKVLSDGGSGSTAGIIEGVNWVAKQHKQGQGKKSVANMSLGTFVSPAFNEAINAAVKEGVHFAVSAGNDYGDACMKSPASATDCVTVAASDIDDKKADFSNYGKCVDIIAPGRDVTSTWKGHTTNTISGTSMAAPHVAGVIAKYLSSSSEEITPGRMKLMLKENASKDKITDIPSDDRYGPTPNDLVYKACD